MRLDFLNTVPYVCRRWAEVVRHNPDAAFLVEEVSVACLTRKQADELSARVNGYLANKGIGREDFVLIRLPRDARLLIRRFSREEYLCNPRPDLQSRRTGNGQ